MRRHVWRKTGQLLEYLSSFGNILAAYEYMSKYGGNTWARIGTAEQLLVYLGGMRILEIVLEYLSSGENARPHVGMFGTLGQAWEDLGSLENAKEHLRSYGNTWAALERKKFQHSLN